MSDINFPCREKLEETSCILLAKFSDNSAILCDEETGNCEVWVLSDDYSGYTIEIDGAGYEFVRYWKNGDLTSY